MFSELERKSLMQGNKKIKILFCIDNLVRGGTELQLIGLIDRLDRSRFSPYLLTLRPSPKELTPKDCCHLPWQVPSLFSLNGVGSLFRLVSFLRSEHFQVVQTFFQDSTVFGGMAAFLAGVPIRIASFRDLGFWRTRKQSLILRMVYPRMTGYLSNAEAVKRNFVQHDRLIPEKICVIYNGIESSSMGWIDHTGPTLHVGIVGNLNRTVKRTDLFIKAAAIVSRKAGAENIRWHIIGEGHLKSEYQELARRENILGKMDFPGRVSDVTGYLEKLQIGVLCSDSEGFSNALLEYMLKGCACVATDVGGNREALVNGQTGLLVPPDNVIALAEALVNLVINTEKRREMSRKAREYAEVEFSWEKCVTEHESVYSGE
jgi:L-malate glycosyltransferase